MSWNRLIKFNGNIDRASDGMELFFDEIIDAFNAFFIEHINDF